MKRDMDLIKKLLETIENVCDGTTHESIVLRGHNYSELQIRYHLNLLLEADLISALVHDGDSMLVYIYPIRLTNSGHDFLANAKDPTRWEKVKSAVNKAGGASLDVIKNALGTLTAAAVMAGIQ